MAGIEVQPLTSPPRARNGIEVIAESAREALTSAILVWVLGGVAFGVAGSFAGQMIPSAPPGYARPAQTEAHHAGHALGAWRPASGIMFGVFFAIFFAHSLWAGFHKGEGNARGRGVRILSNLRENWFGMIVGNAISAWVAALILSVVPSFSVAQILWNWVWAMMLPTVQGAGHWAFGASNSASVGDWVSWYHGNQAKLYFWIIYLGGIIDDLGVPNFKTLARWGWRRWRKRHESAEAAPLSQETPSNKGI